MSLLGACVYAYGGEVEAKLRLLQPHFVVVGSGCWNDADAIAGACAPVQPLLILRDMTENLIDLAPETVMDRMATVANLLYYKKIAFHLLNEQYGDVERAKNWELRAITFAQVPTVALNGAYGNDPDNRFREVAEESTYVGWHLYDGWLEDQEQPDWVAREYTSRRYAGGHLPDVNWPDWWPREKHISTEIGVEKHPGTGQRRGWHDIGLSEEVVKNRILANSMHWKVDGILGACWFTAGHTEQSWNEGYGITELMARAWAKAPAPNQYPNPDSPTNGGDHLPTVKEMLDQIEAKGLAGQITLSAGKKAASYTEQGTQVDESFRLFGDVVNLARDAKKALETPISV